MFAKLLIANRGEIACRIIRTARRMGIATVAVYSEADRHALHTRLADESVCVGPAAAAESYLDAAAIIAACRATGADVVHPGYGFLSEQPAFAQALAASGITFIGPDAAAMAAMGDKIAAKRLAQAAGVSVVPGHPDALADADAAVRIARTIGYPVMLKAAAGGGGKGMRVAGSDAEVRSGFAAARGEAAAGFGDDRLFIEKYIAAPRHIEIQVLADGHGTTLHLGERECSIQRRHQKVIEEAPSPFVDDTMRARMGEQAVALARAVQYRSAGTVEFIVDADHNFYFLEMNTRLQVEHPVTELITGLDLVELMIRIAAGERLTLRQADVRLHGWAIEARVCAEDPARDFAPSPGRLVAYCEPTPDPDLRVDSGVAAGGEIPVFYDPLIAKLCCHAPTRDAAIARMRQALDEYCIRGIAHNLAFLAAILHQPRFVEGRLSTAFIAQTWPDGFGAAALCPRDPTLLLAIAVVLYDRAVGRRHLAGATAAAELAVLCNDTAHAARIAPLADGSGDAVAIDRTTCVVTSAWRPGERLFRGHVGAQAVCVQVDREGLGWRLGHAGTAISVRVLRPRVAELARRMRPADAADRSAAVLSPMAGRLIALSVQVGEAVAEGAVLAVIEAMKMQTELRAPRAGVVAQVLATQGALLAADQPLILWA